MKNKFKSVSLILPLLLTAVFMINACDVTSTEDQENEHSEPWGLVLIMGGSEIARQDDGAISYGENDKLEFFAGQDSDLVTLRFLDEHGDRFVPEDDDFSLGWEIGDEDVLEIDQHEEDGKWSFHFEGKGTGETNVRFQLIHGGHADFTSMEFDVHIKESAQ